jgi:hypothetical protein
MAKSFVLDVSNDIFQELLNYPGANQPTSRSNQGG